MSNIAEIERIEAEAVADEAGEVPPGAGPDILTGGNVAEEFADFLDMAANIAGTGFALPTIPQRFNHAANVQIAGAAFKLCEKYGIDARSVLIGCDSVVGVWLGLLVSIGLPGYGCVMDFKAMKAREVKEAANDDNINQQQG